MSRTSRIQRLAAGFLAIVCAISSSEASAQTGGVRSAGGSSLKVGLLPFSDATASGNRSIGGDIARTLQSALVHSTSLTPRMLDLGGKNADSMDAERAVALGKAQGVDLVFVGTVLEAKTGQSNKRAWLPTVKGQSGSLDVHSVKATVVLQGELYDVASGERLFSERVTGNDTSRSIGGTVYTSFGSWGNNDSYSAFLDSPLGKALQTALSEMTRKVAAARPPER